MGALLLLAPSRLDYVPINPVVGFFPYLHTDTVSLELRRISPLRVMRNRGAARVSRRDRGRICKDDLMKSDWEYGIADIARAEPQLRLGVASYIAVDSVATDGWLEAGRRPVLGQRARKREPIRPHFFGLRTRNASPAALERLQTADLLLVNLTAARGRKTSEILKSILNGRDPRLPTVIVAEGVNELTACLDTLLVRAVAVSKAEHTDLGARDDRVQLVGRERVQHEQQIRFALQSATTSDAEDRIQLLFRAAWRAVWQRASTDIELPILATLRRELEALARASRTARDQYDFANRLLADAWLASAPTVLARRQAIAEAAVAFSGAGGQRVLAVVGGLDDERAVRETLQTVAPRIASRVRTVRHIASSAEVADICVCCGYWGPVTLDAILRTRARSIVWILDPVEAAFAARDCERQAATLLRLSLDDAAAAVLGLQEPLRDGAVGVNLAHTEDHSSILDVGSIYSASVPLPRETTRHLGDSSELELWLSDGSVLCVSDSHRIDVVRAGAPRPDTVAAGELREGDQVLLVRGDHQRTLSDLLLEDMDSFELTQEAAVRKMWIGLCRSTAYASRRSASAIARELRQRGLSVTPENVRCWLKSGPEGRTPSNYKTFRAFSEVLGLQLNEDVLRHYFDAIRRWRVAHRKRGRDVVRLLRLAWFGGLSAGDLARIQEQWGLAVRDLVEGSRVAEVEFIRKYSENT